MRSVVSLYRAFSLGENGRYVRSVELQCADDAEAARAAGLLAASGPVDLWCGGRFVGRIGDKGLSEAWSTGNRPFRAEPPGADPEHRRPGG